MTSHYTIVFLHVLLTGLIWRTICCPLSIRQPILLFFTDILLALAYDALLRRSELVSFRWHDNLVGGWSSFSRWLNQH